MTLPLDGRFGLTAARLREVLHYDEHTGEWRWLKTLSVRKMAGSAAGDLKPSGYVLIGLDGHRYRAHRLAWLYMTGEWPSRQVDHEDTNRANNRWKNLRLATNQQQAWNSPKKKNNRSGFKGVHWGKQRQKWKATIRPNGHEIHLGFFADPLEAHKAYAAAALRYAQEFARAA